MVCEVKDTFTFDEVVKLLREYTEHQAQLHKPVVMQAEGSYGAKGAAVGNSADGQNVREVLCNCLYGVCMDNNGAEKVCKEKARG